MPKLPDGHYPLGAPLDRTDVGAMQVAFHVMRPERFAVLDFGTRLNWFFLTPDKAREMSTTIRDEITQAFGDVPFDVSTLMITVTAIRAQGIIEVLLPQVCNTLGGNPELWLCLAHRIDEERRKLLN